MPKGIYTRTLEHIEKTKRIRLGKKYGPLSIEHKEKLRQIRLGKKYTEETKEKMRQSSLGQIVSFETRKKLRKAHFGKKHTPEHIEKVRQSKIGKKQPLLSQEHKEKIRQRMLGNTYSLGKKLTPEHVEKIRQHHKNPVYREHMRQLRLKQTFPTKMTKIEQALYDEFKKRRLKFEMHKTMFNRFQPDFVFEEAKLIVHADGDYWHSLPEVVERDKLFDKLAYEGGWTVLRFTETAIKQDATKCAKTIAKFVRKDYNELEV